MPKKGKWKRSKGRLKIESGMKEASPGTSVRKIVENRWQEFQVLLSAGRFEAFGGLGLPSGRDSREYLHPSGAF
jgi:hypothetical protein